MADNCQSESPAASPFAAKLKNMYAIHVKVRSAESGHSWPTIQELARELAENPGGAPEHVYVPRPARTGHLGAIYLRGRSAEEAGARVAAAAARLPAVLRAPYAVELLVHAGRAARGLCDATVLLSPRAAPPPGTGNFRPGQLSAKKLAGSPLRLRGNLHQGADEAISDSESAGGPAREKNSDRQTRLAANSSPK
ncbi:hypothetical protein AB0O31_02540 [Kitasatospora cineracea]|uniref:hypothetical protein n=1 Tax=Kitasatospora cineracea TaxID=88074 RepID=UPI003434BC5A